MDTRGTDGDNGTGGTTETQTRGGGHGDSLKGVKVAILFLQPLSFVSLRFAKVAAFHEKDREVPNSEAGFVKTSRELNRKETDR